MTCIGWGLIAVSALQLAGCSSIGGARSQRPNGSASVTTTGISADSAEAGGQKWESPQSAFSSPKSVSFKDTPAAVTAKSSDMTTELHSGTDSLGSPYIDIDVARAWRARQIEALRTSPHSAEVLAVFPLALPGEPAALSLDRSGRLLIWNLASGEARELGRVGKEPSAAALSPALDRLAVAQGREIVVYELPALQSVSELDRINSRVSEMLFDPFGRSLLASGSEGSVWRWRFDADARATRDGRDLERYFGHGAIVGAVAWHPQGRVFFSADWDGILSAWVPFSSDPHAGRYDQNLVSPEFFSERALRQRSDAAGGRVVALQVSADGELLFVARSSGDVEVWRVRGFKRLRSIRAHSGEVTLLALSTSGRRLLSAGRDGHVKVWSITETRDAESTERGSTFADPSERSPTLKELHDFPVSLVRTAKFVDEDRIVAGDVLGRVSELMVGAKPLLEPLADRIPDEDQLALPPPLEPGEGASNQAVSDGEGHTSDSGGSSEVAEQVSAPTPEELRAARSAPGALKVGASKKSLSSASKRSSSSKKPSSSKKKGTVSGSKSKKGAGAPQEKTKAGQSKSSKAASKKKQKTTVNGAL